MHLSVLAALHRTSAERSLFWFCPNIRQYVCTHKSSSTCHLSNALSWMRRSNLPKAAQTHNSQATGTARRGEGRASTPPRDKQITSTPVPPRPNHGLAQSARMGSLPSPPIAGVPSPGCETGTVRSLVSALARSSLKRRPRRRRGACALTSSFAKWTGGGSSGLM